MILELLLIAFGGALGAISRYVSVTYIHGIVGIRFPYGTLLVNGIGSFFMGMVLSLIAGRLASSAEHWRFFLIIGFLGAYTTFSSFAWETWMLSQSGHWLKALGNILANNALALFMVLFGIQTGRLLGGG